MKIPRDQLPLHVQDMLHVDRLKRRKTLSQGQCDNLKYENGPWRVWLSRMQPGDWTMGGAEVPDGYPITVEKLVDGCWNAVYGDGAYDE